MMERSNKNIMKITFTSLSKLHFPLLLEWLQTPYVKKWWDPDVDWTHALIEEKYNSYVLMYKIQDGVKKSIKAYIVYIDNEPIGYFQSYNAYDFPQSKPLIGLPQNLITFDIYIGEEKYLGRGLGTKIIEQFFTEYNLDNKNIFVSVDNNNKAAIRAYKKAGFKTFVKHVDVGEIWMLKEI